MATQSKKVGPVAVNCDRNQRSAALIVEHDRVAGVFGLTGPAEAGPEGVIGGRTKERSARSY